jgi:hypothetical protein
MLAMEVKEQGTRALQSFLTDSWAIMTLSTIVTHDGKLVDDDAPYN